MPPKASHEPQGCANMRHGDESEGNRTDGWHRERAHFSRSSAGTSTISGRRSAGLRSSSAAGCSTRNCGDSPGRASSTASRRFPFGLVPCRRSDAGGVSLPRRVRPHRADPPAPEDQLAVRHGGVFHHLFAVPQYRSVAALGHDHPLPGLRLAGPERGRNRRARHHYDLHLPRRRVCARRGRHHHPAGDRAALFRRGGMGGGPDLHRASVRGGVLSRRLAVPLQAGQHRRLPRLLPAAQRGDPPADHRPRSN